jgi:hypothetical protein
MSPEEEIYLCNPILSHEGTKWTIFFDPKFIHSGIFDCDDMLSAALMFSYGFFPFKGKK